MSPSAPDYPLRVAVIGYGYWRCVRTGERPVTDGLAGLRVVASLEAARTSLDAGGVDTRLSADAVGVCD